MTVAAPSEIDEELAAVTVPSLLKAGFNVGILAMSQVNGVSSWATTRSPLRSLMVTGAISVWNAPASMACSERRTDSAANASCCSRVKPYLRAVASAK